MSINCVQLKEVIIRPALNAIGLCSDEAIQLILGTCAQETNLGRYVVQANMSNFLGGIGLFQMQEGSYNYIWSKHVATSLVMKAKISLYCGYAGKPVAARMASDMALATIMARLYYANILEKLPAVGDIAGMAKYYKQYWNTSAGSASEQQFID